MRKYFYSVLAAGMLFATSCSQDELVESPRNEGQQMTFKVEVPGVAQSRAIADGIEVGAGKYADKLVYAMYEEDQNDILVAGFASDDDKDGTFVVNVPMAKDIKYDILFLAYNEANSAFVIDNSDAKSNNLKALQMKSSLSANQEAYDAFIGRVDSKGVDAAATTTVTLKRPFAQVNAATTAADLTTANILKAEVTSSKFVIYNAPNTLNVFTGEVSGSTTFTYDQADILKKFGQTEYPYNEVIAVDNTNYYYLAMAYVLAGAESSTHDADFSFYRADDKLVSSLSVLSLPVQANFRTNVLGTLLTQEENYEIKIDAEFGIPTHDVTLWDGKTLKEPAYDETTKTYSIYNAAELAYIAALVNGTLDTDNVSRSAVSADNLRGKTISLMDDIYLNNKEWSPIGFGSNHFCGTLEGNNKTIYGLKITQRGDTRTALFGTVSLTVTFRNLTIKGASIECPDFNGDFYGSALIGTAYGNVTIENVDVVDSYISGNNKVGALIAHDGVMSSLTIDGCDVSNVEFNATNIEDGGSVGGLVGYFQGVAKGSNAAPYGEHHIKNSTVKNCVFNVVNSTNTGKRANGELMGGLDSKKNQELYITGCTAGNNEWNEKFYVDGTEVTEGKYRSLYKGLIGGERDDNQEGKVIIDGTQYPHSVAKVGDTEYYFIDEAIAAWTDNTTLALVDNVELTNVIKIKSTEHHTLDLGTYTMTAASGQHAIEITCEGRSNASYALTVYADADNPGGITAKGKSCVYYSKSGSTKDRPIIRIYNGVFNGSYSINSKSNGNTNCPQIWIYGGTFNGNVNLTKNMLRVWGGTFHGWVNCTGDTSAYREIQGGRFKSWQFMTADASSKFWVGTAKETYDVGVYVDDEGYLVVGGPVITGFGDKFTAKATNPTKWSSYLKYSSANANGLYYTNADLAIKKHGEANVELKQ